MIALDFGGEISEGRADMALMTSFPTPPLQLPPLPMCPALPGAAPSLQPHCPQPSPQGPSLPRCMVPAEPRPQSPGSPAALGTVPFICAVGVVRDCPVRIAGGHLSAQTKGALVSLSPFLGQQYFPLLQDMQEGPSPSFCLPLKDLDSVQ